MCRGENEQTISFKTKQVGCEEIVYSGYGRGHSLLSSLPPLLYPSLIEDSVIVD